MKNLTTTFIALTAIILSSCHYGRHVIIATHTDNSDTRLEYQGSLAFSNDGAKVQSISPHGYIDYKHNSDELYVSDDHSGHIRYKMNGTEITKLDNASQGMLDEAVRMIIKSGH